MIPAANCGTESMVAFSDPTKLSMVSNLDGLSYRGTWIDCGKE